MNKRFTPLIAGTFAITALTGAALAADKTPETIFRANCGTCHGQKGAGGTSWINTQAAPKIAGYMSRMMFQSHVRNGFPPQMPAFPSQEINSTELTNLFQYVRGLPGSYVAEPTAQYTVTVTDEDPWYNPMQLTVNKGQTVKFVNTGKTYHPVTQIDYVATRGASGTDSGQLGANGVYYRTFSEAAGSKLTFLCKIHPYMRGEVYVGTSFTPPAYHADTPAARPTVGGTGEVWYNAQWQDWPGKAKDGVVHVFNAATWTDAYQIPVGNNPHNIWMGKGNTKALTTNWYDNTVSVMDTATKTVIGDYVVGAAPAHVTSDWAGNNWYLSIEASYYVQPAAQSNMALGTNRAFVSGYGPHGIWYCNGKLVSANTFDNTFSIINASTMTHVATVPIGLYPLGASCNSAGTLGAAGNYLDATVSIVDLVNKAVLRNVALPGNSVQVPFTPDDKYIVAANSPYTSVIDVQKATAKNPDGTWTYTDAQVIASVWTGKGAHGVAFLPKQGGGQYAVVSHKYENYMSVVDISVPMSPVKAGDVPLVTTTTGRVAIVGITDTGGNAIATNPNPAPWQ